MTDLFAYDRWPSGEPYNWAEAARGPHPHDQIDFHVDLGCGKLKKGRIGVDRYPAEGVNVVADLNTLDVFGMSLEPGDDAVDLVVASKSGVLPGAAAVRHAGQLPFPTSSIESVISHHALEHIGDGFIPLMDEVYRILKPGGVFRAIVPLFPSWSAVCDPDHKRYFLADEHNSTFDAFCGTPGDAPSNCFLASFSVPYTKARFERTHQTITRRLDDPRLWWTAADDREMRITLKAMK